LRTALCQSILSATFSVSWARSWLASWERPRAAVGPPLGRRTCGPGPDVGRLGRASETLRPFTVRSPERPSTGRGGEGSRRRRGVHSGGDGEFTAGATGETGACVKDGRSLGKCVARAIFCYEYQCEHMCSRGARDHSRAAQQPAPGQPLRTQRKCQALLWHFLGLLPLGRGPRRVAVAEQLRRLCCHQRRRGHALHGRLL
jgi:hypothetical protein